MKLEPRPIVHKPQSLQLRGDDDDYQQMFKVKYDKNGLINILTSFVLSTGDQKLHGRSRGSIVHESFRTPSCLRVRLAKVLLKPGHQ